MIQKVLRELPIISNKNYWPNDWGKKTSIMGILNITPDSFSDGGDFINIENALKQADYYVKSGVDVIDIGAQSTRPEADEVGSIEELKRLIPVLKVIRTKYPNLIISVDTFNANVAYDALFNGANWINDVTGGRRDENILDVVSEFSCPFVITHSKGNSKTMNNLENYDDLLVDIIDDLKNLTEIAIKKKVMKKNIIWDPGLGFSKNTSHNLKIIRNLNQFKVFGFPLLIGASRKRFIGEILNEDNPKNRDIGTLAISCLCSQFLVDIVRVHDVNLNYQILKVADKIYR